MVVSTCFPGGQVEGFEEIKRSSLLFVLMVSSHLAVVFGRSFLALKSALIYKNEDV